MAVNMRWRRHTCVYCAAGFSSSREDADFCSSRCRQAAYRRRLKFLPELSPDRLAAAQQLQLVAQAAPTPPQHQVRNGKQEKTKAKNATSRKARSGATPKLPVSRSRAVRGVRLAKPAGTSGVRPKTAKKGKKVPVKARK